MVELYFPGKGKDISQQDYVSLNLFKSSLGMIDKILICQVVESIVNNS